MPVIFLYSARDDNYYYYYQGYLYSARSPNAANALKCSCIGLKRTKTVVKPIPVTYVCSMAFEQCSLFGKLNCRFIIHTTASSLDIIISKLMSWLYERLRVSGEQARYE